MRVEYTNTFLDIVRFQAVHQFLSPAAQAFYGICFFLILLSEFGERSVPSAFLIALVLWALLWLLQFVFNAVYFASKSNRTVLTSHRAEVGEEGFSEETKFNRSLYFWPGVAKVVSRPGFVAVYVSGQQAHVVPKRAFSSKEQMVEFRQLVADRIAKSRDGI